MHFVDLFFRKISQNTPLVACEMTLLLYPTSCGTVIFIYLPIDG